MKKTIKVKVVDFWTGFNADSWWVINMLRKHYNIEFSDKPDFLFFSCFGNDFLNYDNCVKIFYTGENVIPNFNHCDYASGFDFIDFGDRYFQLYLVLPDKTINDRSNITDDFANRRFCNFIYSNIGSGEGALLRQAFCKNLMEYKHVDCPGRVLHNMDTDELEPRNGAWTRSKIDFLKKYKFTIAFENSSSNGYTTEKLFQPFEACSVPIYYGNPLIVKDVNPKSFINCNDYNNDFDAIIERIKYLDTHDDEYLAMLREQPMQPDYDFNRCDKYEQWLCDIIERGNKPFNKDPRNWSDVPYAKTIENLNIENKNLKAENNDLKSEIGSLSVIKQLVNKMTDFSDQIKIVKEKTNSVEQKIDAVKEQFYSAEQKIAAVKEQTYSVGQQIISAVKTKHKKSRKYFNILLACQFVLLIMLILSLF